MAAIIPRDDALALLRRHVASPVMIKHSLASESVLAALADRLGEDRAAWALAGLLHDIDMELTQGDPARHGRESGAILEAQGVPSEVVTAIRRHNRRSTDEPRETKLDHALAAGESMTGLVVAAALLRPDRKLASVQVRSVAKRIRNRGFAPTVDREAILECEHIGLAPEELAEIALAAMQAISGELGL